MGGKQSKDCKLDWMVERKRGSVTGGGEWGICVVVVGRKTSDWDWLSHPCPRPKTAMISISALVTVPILGGVRVHVGRVNGRDSPDRIGGRDHMCPLPESVTTRHSINSAKPAKPRSWEIKYQMTTPHQTLPLQLSPAPTTHNPFNPLLEPWPMMTKMKSSVSLSCR